MKTDDIITLATVAGLAYLVWKIQKPVADVIDFGQDTVSTAKSEISKPLFTMPSYSVTPEGKIADFKPLDLNPLVDVFGFGRLASWGSKMIAGWFS